MAPLVDRNVIESSIRPCLLELSDDGDMDVRFYARQALYACDNVQIS